MPALAARVEKGDPNRGNTSLDRPSFGGSHVRVAIGRVVQTPVLLRVVGEEQEGASRRRMSERERRRHGGLPDDAVGLRVDDPRHIVEMVENVVHGTTRRNHRPVEPMRIVVDKARPGGDEFFHGRRKLELALDDALQTADSGPAQAIEEAGAGGAGRQAVEFGLVRPGREGEAARLQQEDDFPIRSLRCPGRSVQSATRGRGVP